MTTLLSRDLRGTYICHCPLDFKRPFFFSQSRFKMHYQNWSSFLWYLPQCKSCLTKATFFMLLKKQKEWSYDTNTMWFLVLLLALRTMQAWSFDVKIAPQELCCNLFWIFSIFQHQSAIPHFVPQINFSNDQIWMNGQYLKCQQPAFRSWFSCAPKSHLDDLNLSDFHKGHTFFILFCFHFLLFFPPAPG